MNSLPKKSLATLHSYPRIEKSLLLGLGLLALFLFVWVGCSSKSESGTKSGAGATPPAGAKLNTGGKPAMPPIRVQVQVMQLRSFSAPQTVTGTILANQEVELKAEIAGRLTKIDFEEGRSVKTGQLLFQIDDAELKANLASAESRLKLAMAQEVRQKQQLDAGATSQKDYDQASAEKTAAQAQSDLLRAQLAKTSVRAPFAGIAGLLPVYKGSFVQAGTRLTTVQDLSRLKLEFQVPEAIASSIKPGQRIRYLPTGQLDTLEAKVYATEPRLDASTRTLTVRAMAPNVGGKMTGILPGSFAEVIVGGENESALILPPAAIAQGSQGSMVFIAVGGVAIPRPIRLGLRQPEAVQVIAGLRAGDSVITTGLMQLRPMAPVIVNQVK